MLRFVSIFTDRFIERSIIVNQASVTRCGVLDSCVLYGLGRGNQFYEILFEIHDSFYFSLSLSLSLTFREQRSIILFRFVRLYLITKNSHYTLYVLLRFKLPTEEQFSLNNSLKFIIRA